MKSKKRQNGGIKKPNIIAIFICLALVLLLFGGGGTAIYKYNKSSNKLPTEPNYEPGDAFGPFGSDYINHLSNIYHHDEVEVEQDYYMAKNEN